MTSHYLVFNRDQPNFQASYKLIRAETHNEAMEAAGVTLGKLKNGEPSGWDSIRLDDNNVMLKNISEKVCSADQTLTDPYECICGKKSDTASAIVGDQCYCSISCMNWDYPGPVSEMRNRDAMDAIRKTNQRLRNKVDNLEKRTKNLKDKADRRGEDCAFKQQLISEQTEEIRRMGVRIAELETIVENTTNNIVPLNDFLHNSHDDLPSHEELIAAKDEEILRARECARMEAQTALDTMKELEIKDLRSEVEKEQIRYKRTAAIHGFWSSTVQTAIRWGAVAYVAYNIF